MIGQTSEREPSSAVPGTGGYETLIWGTNVNVDDSSRRFRNFLTNFRKPDSPEESEPFYVQLVKDVCLTSITPSPKLSIENDDIERRHV
jgi:hypothetical protein